MGKDERTTQLEHFSHEHCLTLGDDLVMMKNDDEKCDGCIQPILVPFYSCEHFFLHDSCAKLPRKMQHPLHVQHQLTLFAKVFHDGAFQCRACYSLQWFRLYLPLMQLLP